MRARTWAWGTILIGVVSALWAAAVGLMRLRGGFVAAGPTGIVSGPAVAVEVELPRDADQTDEPSATSTAAWRTISRYDREWRSLGAAIKAYCKKRTRSQKGCRPVLQALRESWLVTVYKDDDDPNLSVLYLGLLYPRVLVRARRQGGWRIQSISADYGDCDGM